MKHSLIFVALVAAGCAVQPQQPLVLGAAPRAAADCTVSCTIQSDAFPPAPSPQPTHCRLYDGATMVVSTAVLPVGGGVACNFVQTVPLGVTVSYTATGIFAGVEGPASSPPLMISPGADTIAPTAPSTLTATVVSPTQVNLWWNAATDNVGVTGYGVERCTGVACGDFGPLITVAGLSYADLTVVGSTNYSYRVWAKDAANNVGSPSPVASALTPAPPVGTIKLGETNILANADNGNGNLLLAQGPYTLAATATIQSLSFYVTTVGGNLRLGIYDAVGPNGGPGAKKAETASFTPTCSPAPCWVTAPVIAQVALAAGKYWLTYLPSSSTLAFRKSTIAGVSGKFYSYAFGPMPATFATAPTSTSSHWSLYATLSTGSGPPALPVPTNLILVP